MLKRSINEFTAKLILKSDSAILVKDGRLNDESRKSWEPDKKLRETMPAAIPISRNNLDDLQAAVTAGSNSLARVERLDFYIPGTSLRGAWRSHLERVLRGLTAAADSRVCDPLADADESPFAGCSWVLENERKKFLRDSKEKGREFPAYAKSCPVCRMFGNTTHGARLSISDGRRENTARGRLISREHVRVERHGGQVTGGILKFFALDGANFEVDLTLRNFELWQLLLLNVLLTDIARGAIPVGSGKSKGYGQVSIVRERTVFTATQFGLEKPGETLQGVGEHPLSAGEAQYDWLAGPAAPQLTPPGQWAEESPWRWARKLNWAEFEGLFKTARLNWGSVKPLAARRELRQ